MEEPTPLQQTRIRPKIPAEPLPPIESRFLFVDVAALRAKQLRRGARPRLGEEVPAPHKAERVAMEEVKRGLVYYDVPPAKPVGGRGRRMNADAIQIALGALQGVLSSTVFVLVLFIGFCVVVRLHQDEEDGGRQGDGGQEPRRADQPPADGLFRARRRPPEGRPAALAGTPRSRRS